METGIHELTAAYALDALDADDRAAYEAHLEGCERCREELTSFWETTEALAVGAAGPAPPLTCAPASSTPRVPSGRPSCRSSVAAASSPCWAP